MPVSQGLKNSLNRIREISTEIYHQYIPIIDDDTDISVIAQPVLNTPVVQNEFMSALVNRIVYTAFDIKYFNNPLRVLEGDKVPLGFAGENIYVNPAKGRQFNVDDFAGLLQRYEADVKVFFETVNVDYQYPVTVSRAKLQKAFTSWENLNTFVDEITSSLYNGAYLDQFRLTKELVAGSYKANTAVIKQITAPTTEALAKEFITEARTRFLNFQLPSTEYNSWHKIGGAGKPITTWTNPEDIVFIVRNDIRAYLDVEVLASAFNLDRATLLGNILPVDNFDIYSDEGAKVFDGSAIVGIIADKSYFRIKEQDMQMDEFYNANNRTWNMYLNMVKMYSTSPFANHTIFATSLPTVPATSIEFGTDAIELEAGDHEGLDLTVKPASATTEITYAVTSGTADDLVLTSSDNGRHLDVKATEDASGEYTITATAGSLTDTLTVTVA